MGDGFFGVCCFFMGEGGGVMLWVTDAVGGVDAVKGGRGCCFLGEASACKEGLDVVFKGGYRTML